MRKRILSALTICIFCLNFVTTNYISAKASTENNHEVRTTNINYVKDEHNHEKQKLNEINEEVGREDSKEEKTSEDKEKIKNEQIEKTITNIENLDLKANTTISLETTTSYVIENKTNTSYKIGSNSMFSNSLRYNYIKYDGYSNIVGMSYSEYGEFTLKPYEKLVVSGSVAGVQLYVPEELKATTQKVNTPTYYKVNVNKGETYEFKNSKADGSKIKVLTNASYSSDLRYSIINKNGYDDITSLGYSEYGDFTINQYYSLKFTLESGLSPMEMYIPYEDRIYYKKLTTPTMYSFKINKGETYEFKNTKPDGKPINILNNSSYGGDLRYSIIYKNGYDDITSLSYSEYGHFKVNSNYTAKFTLESGLNPMVIYVPYEDRAYYKKVSIPTIYSFKVSKGETYEFKNTKADGKPIKVLTDSSYGSDFRYSMIYKDGYQNIDSLSYSEYGNFEVKSNYSRKFTLESGLNPMTVYIPYEDKGYYKKVYTPTLHSFQVNRGESYEFKNTKTDGKPIKVLTTANYGTDFRYSIIYKNEYDTIGTVAYSEYGNLTVNSNYTVKFTLESGLNPMTVYVPYEDKDSYKKVSTPTLYKVDFVVGETYVFTNKYDKKIPILTNTNYGTSEKYDFITYDKDGTSYSSDVNAYGGLSIFVNMKTKITLSSGQKMSVYLPYEYREMVTKSTTKAFVVETAIGNKIYSIKNNSQNRIRILNTSSYDRKYNYKIFDNNNKLKYSAQNNYGSIGLDSGDRLEIVPINADIIMYVPSEAKSSITNFAKEDVNKDTDIDILDVACVATKYNLSNSSDKYILDYDINNDKYIDILDIVMVSRKFGIFKL